MQTKLECLPCLLRQTLEAARHVTDDEEVQRAVMNRALDVLRLLDVRQSPPFLAQRMHRILRATIGDSDPYREVKSQMNRLGVALRERLRKCVVSAADPFEAAAHVAIAANCIDHAARSGVTEQGAAAFIEAALDRPLTGSASSLRHAAHRAQRILYLADNAGEIALDTLLIELLPPGSVTVAVRGRPVINDATLEDARAVGLAEWADLIDNGSDAPGTLLEDCSPAFRDAFAAADLIIAKGQGNFESLACRGDRRIHFLLIPKCPLVARHVGAPEDSLVLWTSPRRRRSQRARAPAWCERTKR